MFYEKVSLVTGGFDPIHSGHISYFARAKDFSDFLVVGINTEEWLTNKKKDNTFNLGLNVQRLFDI